VGDVIIFILPVIVMKQGNLAISDSVDARFAEEIEGHKASKA